MKKKTKATVTTEARLESKLRAHLRDKSEVDQKYRILQDDLARTQEALDRAIKVMSNPPRIFKLPAIESRGKGSATVFALLSDVHCDEIVPKHKVNNLNEHNPEISKRRIARFFGLLIKFLRIERHECDVDRLVLWLGGDMFTSSESHGTPVAMDTMDAVEFAKEMIVSGIKFILEEEPKLQVHVVCSVGN